MSTYNEPRRIGEERRAVGFQQRRATVLNLDDEIQRRIPTEIPRRRREEFQESFRHVVYQHSAIPFEMLLEKAAPSKYDKERPAVVYVVVIKPCFEPQFFWELAKR